MVYVHDYNFLLKNYQKYWKDFTRPDIVRERYFSCFRVPDDYGTKVMIVSPKKANYIQAHTFFGASTTIATTAESFDYRGETLWSYRYSLYSGAPQGARCIDELWFGNETKSFDNYGKVYPDQFSIPKGVSSRPVNFHLSYILNFILINK